MPGESAADCAITKPEGVSFGSDITRDPFA